MKNIAYRVVREDPAQVSEQETPGRLSMTESIGLTLISALILTRVRQPAN